MKTTSFASIAFLPVLAALSILVQDPKVPPAKTVATPRVHTSRFGIVADVTANEQPIQLKSVKVNTHIVGMRATTVMETVVFNPNNRVLEGTFSVPLIDGQVVVGMALDINGKMRDAVVVDKTKGRATFEAIQRRGVDPALVEWTRDNAFKTRVYPIMAQQTRTVRIVLEQDLTQGPDGFQYTLPMSMTDTVRSFVWDVRVDGFGTVPSVVGDGLERVEFTGNGRQYTYRAEHNNVLAQRPFVIDVPIAPSADVVTVNTWKGEKFFSIAATSPNAQTSMARPTPASVTIVWDASYSARLADRGKHIQFLRELFTRWPNVAVRLDVVAHQLLDTRQYTLRKGDARAIIKDLETMPLDGATNLAAIPFPRYSSDVVLVFSDGVQTYGPAVSLQCPRPTYCIVSTPTADADRLRALANSTGGALIDLASASIADAVSGLSSIALVLDRVRILDGHVEHVYPATATTAGLGTTILGLLKGASATIELTFTHNGKAVEQRVVMVSADRHARDGAMAVRQWAAMRIAQLAANRRTNADSIAALGLQYAIVTPRTSLIVLETLADYVRYDIEPPANEPELVAQWNSQRASTEKQKQPTDDETLNVRLQHMLVNARAEVELRDTTYIRQPRTRTGVGAAPLNVQSTPLNVQSTPLDVQSTPLVTINDRSLRKVIDFADALSVDEQRLIREGNVATEALDDRVTTRGDVRTSPSIPMVSNTVRREAWFHELESRKREQLYAWYLQRRGDYERAPGFFLDVAEQLRMHGDTTTAIRVLTTLAELEGENHRVMRVLGRRLLQYGKASEAIHVFHDVMDIRDEEPQSYRDLALALDAAGKHQEAVDLFLAMAKRKWDDRFPEVQLIALNEMNRIIGLRRSQVQLGNISAALLYDATSDLRIVMDWDADNCDMDLMITEPNGTVCFYGNRITASGRLSRDLVGGYGPEEYVSRKAPKGRFMVHAKYYGDRQQHILGATTVQVTVFRNYGRPNETAQHHTLRLGSIKENAEIAAFDVK